MLFYLVGPPGAGKTTLAQELRKANPELQPLSIDAYLYRHLPITQKNIQAKSHAGWASIATLCRRSGSWIVETAFSKFFQELCWWPGKRLPKARLVIKLDAPVQFLLRRVMARKRQVIDEHVIIDQSGQMQSSEAFWKNCITVSRSNSSSLAPDLTFRVDMASGEEIMAATQRMYDLRKAK